MTRALLLLLALGFLGAAACVYFGVFNVAADEPHGQMLRQLLETVRQRSVMARANGIPIPPLDDPALVAEGAEHYGGMCSGCHLAPGVTDSEIQRACIRSRRT